MMSLWTQSCKCFYLHKYSLQCWFRKCHAQKSTPVTPTIQGGVRSSLPGGGRVMLKMPGACQHATDVILYASGISGSVVTKE